MLSPLSRGYGSWDGPFLDPYSSNVDQNHLPSLDPDSHRHGVTVGSISRAGTSLSTRSNTNAPPSARAHRPREIITDLHVPSSDGRLLIPKTYLTRKGALVLFSAPEGSEENPSANPPQSSNRVNRVKTLIDNSLKLGTLDRLAMSVLQYGDEDYDKENVSISDEKNKMFMKFLRKMENEEEVDARSRPGSDLGVYLRDLKVRSSSRFSMSGNTYIPRNREVLELEAILHGLQDGKWPMVYNNESSFDSRSNSFTDQFTRPSSQQSQRVPSAPPSTASTPRSILSSSKLRASLKSYNTYLGRPAVHEERTPQVPKGYGRRRLIISPGSDSEGATPARLKRMAPSLTGGSIVEEEEAEGDEYNYDALTGMEGSTIFTDSTGLDKHMFLLDPSGDKSFHVGDGGGDGYGDGDDKGAKHEAPVESVVEGSDDEDVEMLYVAGIDDDSSKLDTVAGNVDVCCDVQSKKIKNIDDKSTQYENVVAGNDESYNEGINSASLNDAFSVRSSLGDLPSTDLKSDFERHDGETSTTISEDLIEPSGINKVDIKTVVTGTIEEEEGVGVDIAFEGEGHEAEGQGIGDVPCVTDEVEHGGDWSKRADSAANIEVEFTTKSQQGDDLDLVDGQQTVVEESEVISPVDNVSPAPQQSAPHKVTSPESSRKSSPLPISPSQRKSSVASENLQRRKSSVPSMVNRKTPSPTSRKTPSPVGIITTQKSPSPEVGTKSATPDQGQDISSQEEAEKVPLKSELIAKSPSPEMIRGKNTPPAVVIRKKSEGGQSSLSTPPPKTPPSQLVDKTPKDKAPPTQVKQVTPSPVQKKKSLSPEVVVAQKVPSPGDRKSLTPVSQQRGHSRQEEVAPRVQEVAQISRDEVVAQVADDAASVASSVLREQDIILPKEEDEEEEGDEIEDRHTGTDQGSTLKEKITEYEKPEVTPSESVPPPPSSPPPSESKTADPPSTEVHDNVEPEKETAKPAKDEYPVIPDFLKPKPQKPAKGRGLKTKKAPTKPVKKDVAKSISIASVQPDEPQEEKDQGPIKFDHKKIVIPKEKEKTIIPDFVADAAARATSDSKKELEDQIKQMSQMLDSTLGGTILDVDAMDGLTEAELELAKQEMEEKLAQAQEKLEDMDAPLPVSAPPPPKPQKPKTVQIKGKGKGSKKGTKPTEPSQKDVIKMQRQLEKQIQERLSSEKKNAAKQIKEKQELEAKIKEKQLDVEDQEKVTRDRELQIQLEMERLKQQEEEMQQAEEDVRAYLAESRKKQRDEREARKRADQERRKQLAKEKFEAEKKKREEESKKAMEELERIHDIEIRRQKREEEESRREEEERLAQEQEEEEERERMKEAEELEKKLREIEQEEEEKAIQRLIDEREEAARLWREKEEERQMLLEEEERQRQVILEDQLKLEAEMRLKEEEEEKKREAERRRYQELKQMEEDARLKMQQELQRRREVALARREQNLERRSNMDRLKQSQGITKAWVFSYFIRWPLESYNIPFGGAEPKNNRRPARPKPNQGVSKSAS